MTNTPFGLVAPCWPGLVGKKVDYNFELLGLFASEFSEDFD